MSEYSAVQKGSLKLKGVTDVGIKKKNKKKKQLEKELRKKIMEQVTTGGDSSCDSDNNAAHFDARRTKAELAFERAKEKRMIDELVKKPVKSHKERIVEFNENLDKLSEHYDIPKVSWTK